MMQVEGFVQEIAAIPTRTGKTMYNVKVNGATYGAGLYPPKFREGDFISFTATMNGKYSNMETRTVTVRVPPAGAVAPQKEAPKAVSKDSPNWDARQDTISRQAALNSALTMANMLVAAGAVIGLDKAKTPADKMSLLEALVKDYTQQFYAQSTGKMLDLGTNEGPSPESPGEGSADNWT